jgi:hypothetical protein
MVAVEAVRMEVTQIMVLEEAAVVDQDLTIITMDLQVEVEAQTQIQA